MIQGQEVKKSASHRYQYQQRCPQKLWNAAGETGAAAERSGRRAGLQRNIPGSGTFRVYGDEETVNPAKVYVDVLAEFSKEGVLRPCRITWEDGRRYMIDRVKKCERRASRKAGGMGLMYTCMVGGQEVNLFYEENMKWFVTRK